MRARDGQKQLPDVSRASWKADRVSGFVLTNPNFTSRWMRVKSSALAGKFPTEVAKESLTLILYFCNYRNMRKPDPLLVSRSADRFAALGAEPRLQIVRVLLSAHPTGLIAGEIQEELEIPASTLSHHLEKLKQVGLVNVRREGTFLWYSANTDALREVLGFLYEECCTRSRAVSPESFVQISR
jgi:ArsR family transcriptional regulator, arsenate/arsenite/antimonite-responsive transcriptional repressor